MAASILKRIAVWTLSVIGVVLWLAALVLLAKTSQDSAEFGRLQVWIFLFNAAAVLVLLVLIGINLSRLIGDYRRHVPGSKLKARMVTTFVVLAVAPLLLVFYFSVQFLNRGIDSWFDFKVELGHPGDPHARVPAPDRIDGGQPHWLAQRGPGAGTRSVAA